MHCHLIGVLAGQGYRFVLIASVAHDAYDGPQTLPGLAGGAIDQLGAVAGVHREPDAAHQVAYGSQGVRLSHHVVCHVQQVLDLLRQAGRVAVAESGDVQRPFLGAEGGQ